MPPKNRSRKNKDPSNLLKQNSILAGLILEAPSKLTKKKPRNSALLTSTQAAGQKEEFFNFKDFFDEKDLNDEANFEAFINDLAENGFADEMAKQINSKIASASHNNSFQISLLDDAVTTSKNTNKTILSEISNVAGLEKSTNLEEKHSSNTFKEQSIPMLHTTLNSLSSTNPILLIEKSDTNNSINQTCVNAVAKENVNLQGEEETNELFPEDSSSQSVGF